MKRTILACLSLGFLLLTVNSSASVSKPPPPPEDTTIRILLIADIRESLATINQAKSYLLAAWQGTNFGTNLNPTTITIANGGSAIRVPGSIFNGDADDQLDNLRDHVAVTHPPYSKPLRDIHHADIVLGISFLIDDACGKAPQDTWGGVGPFFLGPNFKPEPIHDLREANEDYIGVAQLAGIPCVPSTLAHEFGHLLGGGHWYSAYKTDGGLFENSKSFRMTQWIPWATPQIRFILTAMVDGSPIDVGCPLVGSSCIYTEKYSDFDSPVGNRNAQAFKVTARSVANYRSGGQEPVPPSTCSDGIDNDDDNLVDTADNDCNVCGAELCPTPPSPPQNCDATIAPLAMVGWQTPRVCVIQDGHSWTEYEIVWAHVCPQQVSHYEIWVAQPVLNPYIFKGSVIAPEAIGWVDGSPARVRVRSCGVGGCSGLSSASFLMVDTC